MFSRTPNRHPEAGGRAQLRFTLKKGLDIPLAGAPSAEVDDGKRVSRVAYTAFDDFGPKRLPTLAVQVGDRVRLGQPLTRRKAFPAVVGTAPASGVVEAINRGARRSLETIVIRLDAAPDSADADGVPDRDQETFNRYRTDELAGLSRAQVRENLLAAGLWLAFRTRPFSMIPPPDSVPDALFVTAMDTRPLAADPAPLIRAAGGDLAAGLRLLSRLTDGPVYVCARPDAGLPIPEHPPSEHARSGRAPEEPPSPPQIRVAEFAGPHPAGLPGTHIHFLRPASLTHMVWHIGWQDVIAIGRLFLTGRIDPTRLIALCGPMVARPRMVIEPRPSM